MLSFIGHMLLIRHVLQAIHVYHMILMGMTKGVVETFYQIFRSFFWSYRKGGEKKISLIAWKLIIQPKNQGGLGFKDLTDHASTLLSKWMVRFLDDPTSEWALLFKANLRLLKWKGKCNYKRMRYSLRDKILFGEVISIGACQYMLGLWKAWIVLRESATICQSRNVIPSRWAILDLVFSMANLVILPTC